MAAGCGRPVWPRLKAEPRARREPVDTAAPPGSGAVGDRLDGARRAQRLLAADRRGQRPGRRSLGSLGGDQLRLARALGTALGAAGARRAPLPPARSRDVAGAGAARPLGQGAARARLRADARRTADGDPRRDAAVRAPTRRLSVAALPHAASQPALRPPHRRAGAVRRRELRLVPPLRAAPRRGRAPGRADRHRAFDGGAPAAAAELRLPRPRQHRPRDSSRFEARRAHGAAARRAVARAARDRRRRRRHRARRARLRPQLSRGRTRTPRRSVELVARRRPRSARRRAAATDAATATRGGRRGHRIGRRGGPRRVAPARRRGPSPDRARGQPGPDVAAPGDGADPRCPGRREGAPRAPIRRRRAAQLVRAARRGPGSCSARAHRARWWPNRRRRRPPSPSEEVVWSRS
jgi:hypothetical protein